MSLRLSLSGIYDQRTLSFLLEKGIDVIGFDLRPRSFNFVQGYRLLEIIQGQFGFCLMLQFSNEKEFIIKKLIKECRDAFSGEIILYFCSDESDSFCNSFGLPYYKKITGNIPLPTALDNLSGVVFGHHYIEYLGDHGALDQFAKDYYQYYGRKSQQLTQILEGDWDSNYRPSLCELWDLDYLMLPINQKVEVCFRNVDLKGLETSLKSAPDILR